MDRPLDATPSEQLLALLRERSFRRGTFTLTSGKTSDFFIDCKPTILRADGLALVGGGMLAATRALVPDAVAVAGVVLGGCPLASVVSFASADDDNPLDAILVRKSQKEHGSRKLIEGADHLDAGAKLAVLEDTVTTGGSTLRAVQQLREAGFEVGGVVAIVDREEGGAENIRDAGVAFRSLYRRSDFMG